VVLYTGVLHAQSTNGSISGRVTDPSKALIVGAKVGAASTATKFRYETTTNGSGQYYITSLPPGNYRIEVEKTGFKKLIKPDVIVHIQDALQVDFEMTLGSTSESITVEGGAPLVSTESVAVSTVIDHRFVEDLPLNGRSFQSLITLTPGVVLTSTAYNNQGQFSVNGQRSDSNYFTVDGVSANVGVAAGNPINSSAAGSLPALSIAGGTASLISVDAVQEFKIQTSSFAPEFGRTPGAQISIASRPGTNAFHGSAFEYFRNGSLDASDWFTAPYHVTKPDVHQNDFGGVFGGPIRLPGYNGQDKTFFFVSYEGLRLRQPHVAVTDVPTLAIRQSAVPSIAPILNAFPIAAANAKPDPLDSGLVSYSGSFSSPSTLNATSFRIDHNVNGKLTIFGRYNYAPSNNSERGSGGLYSLSTSFLTKLTTQTLTAGANWIVTPRVSNEFRFNWSRSSTTDTAEVDNFGGATVPPTSVLFPPGLSGQDAVNLLFIETGMATIVADGKNVDNRLQQLNFVDNVSFLAGKHEFKFGVDYRHITTSLSPRAFLELGLFSSAQEAATGVAFLAEKEGDKTNGAVLFQNTGLYAQDTFHVTRLTIVYGLRWDLNPPPTGLNGFRPYPVVGIENPATASLGRAGAPLWATTYNNFAPRLGINYALWNHAGWETVIRAGGGTFYDLGSGVSGNVLAGGTFPLGATDLLFGVPYPLTGANAIPPTPGGTPVALTGYPGFDPNLRVPRTYQWNLAAQQSLGANQSLSLTYVGAGGRKLLRQENYVIAPGVNPTFSNILFQTNSGGSNYNALQAQFQKRLSKGLQILASYTYGHSIDNVSNEVTGAFPTPYDPGEDRGPSDFDIRHAFAGSYSYSIPLLSNNRPLRAIFGNWSLDGIVRAYSAPPVDVEAITTTSDVTGYPIPRPNLVAGQPRYIEGSDCVAVFGSIGCPGGRGFNPSAFSNAGVIGPSGNVLGQGDLPRNALRGFRLVQFDSAFRRDVRLAERVDLQFRADFFNIFNHPNFAPPASILSLPTFGQSISMLGTSLGSGGVFGGQNPLHQIGGPRSVQLALKLQF
jgi:hypothetical protein